MSKIIPIGKARDVLNKNMIEANKDVGKEDPMKVAYERSKDLKESQSLPYRRDVVALDLSQIDELIVNLIRWSNLFSRVDKDVLSDEYEYLKVVNNALFIYMYSYDKKLKKPTESKYAQLFMMKHYISQFLEYSKNNDDFMDMEYQPHIFLRTFAGKVTEVALSISMKLRSNKDIQLLAKGYFPRCEKLGYRNFAKDAERKMAWVEKHQAMLANEQLEKAVENGKGKE